MIIVIMMSVTFSNIFGMIGSSFAYWLIHIRHFYSAQLSLICAQHSFLRDAQLSLMLDIFSFDLNLYYVASWTQPYYVWKKINP